MKKKIFLPTAALAKAGFLLFSFYFLINNFSSAQNPLVKLWDKRFGGTEADVLACLLQTKDGGYILAGYSYSGISGDKTQSVWGLVGNDFDYWIVKIDVFGNKEWDKDFGGTDWDHLTSLQQTSDGGYLLGGFTFSDVSGDKTQPKWNNLEDYWIVKIDSLGNKEWDKDFGGYSSDQLGSLQQTFDGGYILGGVSNSGIGGDKTQPNWDITYPYTYDYWIVKTDSLGNKLWDKNFGGTDQDLLYALQQTSDGGYILGGFSSSGISGDKSQASQGNFDYWIVKTDSLGNKQWDKDFGGTDIEMLSSMQQTTDGGFILGGWSQSGIGGDKSQPSIGNHDYWIIKLDSFGNKQWDKDFGGTDSDELHSLQQTADGGYLLAGTSMSSISGNKTEDNLGQEQTWIVKTDSLGNKQWDKTIFTSAQDQQGLAMQTRDGCYVTANFTSGTIAGYKTQAPWNNNGWDYWIVKFCDSTLIGINEFTSENSFLIFPNPTNGKFEIKNSGLRIESIEIYNVLGEKMPAAFDYRLRTVDCGLLPSGIYFVKATAGEKILFGKVVKE